MGVVTDINAETKDRVQSALLKEFKARLVKTGSVFQQPSVVNSASAQFNFSFEIEQGQIKITPHSDDARAKQVIAQFSNELRQNTGNVTWSDRVSGKSNKAERPGTFTATYTWGGQHYYKAYSWQEIAEGLNRVLKDKIDTVELTLAR